LREIFSAILGGRSARKQGRGRPYSGIFRLSLTSLAGKDLRKTIANKKDFETHYLFPAYSGVLSIESVRRLAGRRFFGSQASFLNAASLPPLFPLPRDARDGKPEIIFGQPFQLITQRRTLVRGNSGKMYSVG